MERTRDRHSFLEDIHDADVRLIDAVWDLRTEKPFELRPSNRHVVRQGCLALDRLGERLAGMLSTKGVAGYTSFPVVAPRIRFRRVPKRLLLDFILSQPSQLSTTTQSIFVEFTATSWSLGLSVKSLASEQENKEFWKRLRNYAPLVFKELQDGLLKDPRPASPGAKQSDGWRVAPYRAPFPQGASSTDLKKLLETRSNEKNEKARSFMIKKTSSSRRASFSSLAAELIATVEIFRLTSISEEEFGAGAIPSKSSHVHLMAEAH